MSPDGKVVVWDKCQANGTVVIFTLLLKLARHVYDATLDTPPARQVRRHERSACRYVSDKSGENDIYIQRVDGSNEMHLALAGDQRDVRISGNLIAFETKKGFWWDVFLYDLSTARLYQVTDTARNESEVDVITGCGGLNRIVYTTTGPYGDWDVWESDFQLPHSVSDEVNDLSTLLESFNLPSGNRSQFDFQAAGASTAINA